MLKFTFEDNDVTKELLLSKYTEETYMEYYLGIPVKKGLFCSPLRTDHHKTASFYRDKAGNLIFKDFGSSFSGNFISVVMEKFGCTYHKALKIIANDFGIKNYDITKNKGKINKEAPKFVDEGSAKIQIEVQNFTKAELDWWNDYGITKETLEKFKVFSCKTVFLNDQVFTMVSPPNMVFGYYGGKMDGFELWRVYYPRKKNYRWLTNWPSKKIQGFEMLPKKGNVLCITKSMKDVMVLHEFGIPAIAPCSENLFISKSVLEQLKSRFKYIVILYDNDVPGLSNMQKIRKDHPELIYTWLPHSKAKDISDFRKEFGKEETNKLIINFLKWLIERNRR